MKGDNSAIFPSTRLGLVVLLHFIVFLYGATDASIHFAWICMVNNNSYNNESISGKLNWTLHVQENIFAADNWATTLFIIPFGWLAETYGIKHFMSVSLLTVGLSTILLPFVAHANYWCVVALRFLFGLCASLLWPVIYHFTTRWVPRAEMGFVLALIAAGFQTGPFVNMLTSGFICTEVGWPAIFYVWGGACLLTVPLWQFLFKNSPADVKSKLISVKERSFIMQNCSVASSPTLEKTKTPWKALCSSSAVFCIVVADFSYSWSTFFVYQYTPSYFGESLKLTTQMNGIYSAIPYVCLILTRILAGRLSDRHSWKPKYSLRIFNSIGLIGMALCQIALGLLPHDCLTVFPILLIGGVYACAGFCTAGYMKAPMHLAPRHSAVIGSMCNFLGSAAGIIMPYVVGTIISSAFSWPVAFYISAAIATVGGVLFLVFVNGEVAPWAGHMNELPVITRV